MEHVLCSYSSAGWLRMSPHVAQLASIPFKRCELSDDSGSTSQLLPRRMRALCALRRRLGESRIMKAWRRYLRFWGTHIHADVKDELQFHVLARVREYEAHGFSHDEAVLMARERFGDVNRVADQLVAHDRAQQRRADCARRPSASSTVGEVISKSRFVDSDARRASP